MGFDLTNQNISDTFQNLLQKTGSEGHLYDLTGNQVDNLTIGGTLTAHSYVTSESIVNTSSGSTAFGNTVDDLHIFSGSIEIVGSASVANNYLITHKSEQGNWLKLKSKYNKSAVQINQTTYGGATLKLMSSHSADTAALTSHYFSDPFAGGTDHAYVNWSNNKVNSHFGVGISEPTSHLHVSGNILATGNIHGNNPNQRVAFGGADTGSGKTLTVKGAISASGDLYVGNSTDYISGSNGNLKITGRLSAKYKSFDIPHPTKPNKRLVYGSLEGPEYGVYIRGKLENENIIYLPEYWKKLVDENTITVQLTPIKNYQKLYVEKIKSNKVYIGKSAFKNINCYYNVYAERKDEKIEVEVNE